MQDLEHSFLNFFVAIIVGVAFFKGFDGFQAEFQITQNFPFLDWNEKKTPALFHLAVVLSLIIRFYGGNYRFSEYRKGGENSISPFRLSFRALTYFTFYLLAVSIGNIELT